MTTASPISIHALREEGDLNQSTTALTPLVFLSTPSARRATSAPRDFLKKDTISIHALREEGDACPWFLGAGKDISIHALREEGDRSPRR